MDSFLRSVANFVLENHKHELEKTCIILPNKRASLYLRKHMSELLKSASFTPSFLTIEELVEDISGHEILSNINQLFILYEAHQLTSQKPGLLFEEFLEWAPIVLADFNDTDLYLTNTSLMFDYLSEAKAIALWNPSGNKLTDFQKEYLEFFLSLKELYRQFNHILKTRGYAYKGMAYRYVAENIETLHQKIPWKNLVFAGFNAFSKSEETFISTLIKLGKAKLLWDADRYYLDDPFQEAGNFIREFITQDNSGTTDWISEDLKNNDRTIEIIGSPSITAQARLAGSILKEWHAKDINPDDTAVILADENLLLPVMNAIPSESGTFNLTMGYPLHYSPVFSLFNTWLKIQVKAFTENNINNPETRFLHKNDLLDLFRHPYFRLFQYEKYDEVMNELMTTNQYLFSIEEILGLWPDNATLVNKILRIPGETANITGLANEIILTLMERFRKEEESSPGTFEIDVEFLYHFSKLNNLLGEFTKKYPEYLSIKSFYAIFKKLIRNVSVPFFGEPLKGLQIMGFLETRTLDFRNLIILAMNEGIYPDSRSMNSFIPYEIRNEFKLPGYKEKNSIYAYHFYRLLQRAENVVLTYCTEPDLIAGGGKSRFLEQIMAEFPKKCPSTILAPGLYSFSLENIPKPRKIEIMKDSRITDILKSIAEKGFSPSALSIFIRCPLQFYFKYILHLKEAEESQESMDEAMLGTLVHETLHLLYKPFENRELTEDLINIDEDIILQSLSLALKEQYPKGNIDSGRNLLIYNVAKNLVKNFIAFERERVKELSKQGFEVRILSLEEKYRRSFNINIDDEILPVSVTGKIDRVEFSRNEIHIIDYKTGFVLPSDLKITEWERLLEEPRYNKALQLLIYAWLFKGQDESNHKLRTGILPLRSLKNGTMPLFINKSADIDSDILDMTEKTIVYLLEQIFDPSTTFYQTDNQKNCDICFFKDICIR